MKKLVAVCVVVGVVVAGAAWAFGSSPERRVCTKLGELCGSDDASLKDLDECVDDLEELEKAVGEQPIEDAGECLDKVDTCPAAIGCVAGVVGCNTGPVG